jgi:hypothetical protein
MATFNEIYQSYLQNPYAGVNAIAPVQGIGSLINTQPNVGSIGDSTTPTPTTTTTTGFSMPSITAMDVLGLAMNPALGITNLGVKGFTGKSIAQHALNAMGIGGGYGGKSSGYGVDSVAGMASGPTHGVDDVNSQSVGADASAGGAAGAAAASAAGANDGPDTGGSFAKGGRVGFSNGSSGQDYWITVQEMYDNAGGEAGTGLGLIDFANKYFPKMADGGRAGYLQGGLVSLLR